MKKLLTIALALTLALSVTACGKTDVPATPEAPAVTPATTPAAEAPENDASAAPENAIDVDAVLANADVSLESVFENQTIGADLNAAERAQLIAEAAAEGTEISFAADGTMTVVEADGTTSVQSPDGSWVVEGENFSAEVATDGGWPSNEYTKLVPKPVFTVTGTFVEDGVFIASFAASDIDTYKSYVEELRGAGYTINETVEDYSSMDMYIFTASNIDGVQVDMTFMLGTPTMAITTVS